jgi:hypothetical protein
MYFYEQVQIYVAGLKRQLYDSGADPTNMYVPIMYIHRQRKKKCVYMLKMPNNKTF